MPTFMWMMDRTAPLRFTSVMLAMTIEYQEQDSIPSIERRPAEIARDGQSQRTEARMETLSSRPARRTEPGHEHSTCASGSQNERG